MLVNRCAKHKRRLLGVRMVCPINRLSLVPKFTSCRCAALFASRVARPALAGSRSDKMLYHRRSYWCDVFFLFGADGESSRACGTQPRLVGPPWVKTQPDFYFLSCSAGITRMAMTNPILEELHATRERLLAEVGGTVSGLVERLQAEQDASNRREHARRSATRSTEAAEHASSESESR